MKTRLDKAIKRITDRYYENTVEAARKPKLPLSQLIREELLKSGIK